MKAGLEIKTAEPQDLEELLRLLNEAADWLVSIGQPLWAMNELAPERIAREIEQGLFQVAMQDGAMAGAFLFQMEDPTAWPDMPLGEATYIHRFAVARAYGGSGLSNAMLEWSKKRTRELGRKYVRLDCLPRPRLCAFYERNGFVEHSRSRNGVYDVVRYECAV